MTVTNMTVVYDSYEEWMSHSNSDSMKGYDYSTVLQMKNGKIKVTYKIAG